jgi:hypothetical protein
MNLKHTYYNKEKEDLFIQEINDAKIALKKVERNWVCQR